MNLFVSSNVSSLNANRQLFRSNNKLCSAFARLLSGFPVNGAKDDATDLQISNRLTSLVLGLNQAVQNANDAKSLSLTLLGALVETTSASQRFRVLTVQSQNGSKSPSDRVALQNEVTALNNEIRNIASPSQIGGVNVLDGFFHPHFWYRLIPDKLYPSIFSKAQASVALTSVSEVISIVGVQRSDLGAIQNRFYSTYRNVHNIFENVSTARSRIRDTYFAVKTAESTRLQIIQQASFTVLRQAN